MGGARSAGAGGHQLGRGVGGAGTEEAGQVGGLVPGGRQLPVGLGHRPDGEPLEGAVGVGVGHRARLFVDHPGPGGGGGGGGGEGGGGIGPPAPRRAAGLIVVAVAIEKLIGEGDHGGQATAVPGLDVDGGAQPGRQPADHEVAQVVGPGAVPPGP